MNGTGSILAPLQLSQTNELPPKTDLRRCNRLNDRFVLMDKNGSRIRAVGFRHLQRRRLDNQWRQAATGKVRGALQI